MSTSTVFLVILIMGAGRSEKATSYVSVSKAHEGGYSYEVVHDYPTKGSSASVHVYGDVDDYERVPDVSYDYEIKHDGGIGDGIDVGIGPPIPGHAPKRKAKTNGGSTDASPYPQGVKNFGVIKHSFTSPGKVYPSGQAYSSNFADVSHKTRGQKGNKPQSGKYLHKPSPSGHSSSNEDFGKYRQGKHSFSTQQVYSGGPSHETNLGGFGEGIHTSASGPGFTFSDPKNYPALSPPPFPTANTGPVIFHHHVYSGHTSHDSVKNGVAFNEPAKNPFPTGQTSSKNPAHHLGTPCSNNEVTPLPYTHPRKPDDGVFDFPDDFGDVKDFEWKNEDFPANFPSSLGHKGSLNGFPTSNAHAGGKKGKWRPVIVTSKKPKGKLHTFRISKDFKPGNLMGGFKPSFGPPIHHKTPESLRSYYEGLITGHQAGENVETHDPFAHFKDASYFDYDSFSSNYDNHGHQDHFDDLNRPLDEFSDYGSAEEGKSLGDYHNSLTGYGYGNGNGNPSKTSGLRQGKTVPLSVRPIVVPPLKTVTTTVRSSTTVTSPIPNVGISSFVDSPSPLAVHALHDVSGRHALHAVSGRHALHDVSGRHALHDVSSRHSLHDVSSRQVPSADQATSYASSNNLSLGRPSKKRNG